MVVLNSRNMLLNSMIRLWLEKFLLNILNSGLVRVIIYEMFVSRFRCISSVSDRLRIWVWLCRCGGSLLVRIVMNIRLLMLRMIFSMIRVVRLS